MSDFRPDAAPRARYRGDSEGVDHERIRSRTGFEELPHRYRRSEQRFERVELHGRRDTGVPARSHPDPVRDHDHI